MGTHTLIDLVFNRGSASLGDFRGVYGRALTCVIRELHGNHFTEPLFVNKLLTLLPLLL
jgi:hypothetical protein